MGVECAYVVRKILHPGTFQCLIDVVKSTYSRNSDMKFLNNFAIQLFVLERAHIPSVVVTTLEELVSPQILDLGCPTPVVGVEI